ncbi:peptidyl-prolyl cis-trans isomerase CYP95-like [Neltuma alba]|uniref:peptidyl-prolyl cis-trans isomerase CYP95-like n=1 Tax=Neltuma alba TaxID=207710 RepID=UPI0010A58215|nr:peptidyl-prolyl cis-trans isomerase CYP95-like [Prosopis alba]
MAEKKNPLVYMDVSVDNVYVGRMIFEVPVFFPILLDYNDYCEKEIGPKTGLPLRYKSSFFYQILSDISYVKGGDLFSPWVEMPRLKHDERGLLTMNLCDRYGIGSHFVITLKPDSSLDRFHVVFGKIIWGFKTLDKITEADVDEGARVQVSGCGEYNLREIRPGENKAISYTVTSRESVKESER